MATGTERAIIASASAVLPGATATTPAVAQTGLCFADDTTDFRTGFRDYVLNLAYTVACRELGDALRAAEVSAWHWPDEPAPPRLLLTLWADVGIDEWRRVNKVLIEMLIQESAGWSSAEVEDCRQTIDIEVEVVDS